MAAGEGVGDFGRDAAASGDCMSVVLHPGPDGCDIGASAASVPGLGVPATGGLPGSPCVGCPLFEEAAQCAGVASDRSIS